VFPREGARGGSPNGRSTAFSALMSGSRNTDELVTSCHTALPAGQHTPAEVEGIPPGCVRFVRMSGNIDDGVARPALQCECGDPRRHAS
jgi:hypothetical protein